MAKKIVTEEKIEKTPAPREHAGTVQEYQSQGAWGGEEIANEDLVIPKILLMQPMSVLVTEGIAKIGEFRDSLNKDRSLGSDKSPVEIIVFGSFKTWIEYKDGEYDTTKKMDATNADLPLEEILEDGSVITRDKVLNFYNLVAGDISSGEAFPFVLSCRRSSYQTGKKLSTHIKKLQMFKKPSAAKVFSLSSRKETNEKGTFFVTDVEVLRDATSEEMATAYEWYKLLAKAKVKVDESDLVPDSASTVSPQSTTAENSARM